MAKKAEEEKRSRGIGEKTPVCKHFNRVKLLTGTKTETETKLF